MNGFTNMNLPDVERVIYGKTTLAEVVCQFRFPTILKIGSTSPTDFQEIIRHGFPLFSLKPVPQLQALPDAAKQVFSQIVPKAYGFTNEKENTQITLTQDFLAISTTDYKRFENFMENTRLALEALDKVYKPSFYARVGLRYIDIIKRSSLETVDVPWKELLNLQFAGELANDLFENISEIKTNTLYRFDRFSLRCQHGLLHLENVEEECYIIDNDFFEERRIKFKEIENVLKCFNEAERRFLRHNISDRLYKAMEPRSARSS